MAQSQKVAEIYAELQLKTAQFKQALGEATGAMRAWSAETRRQSEEARGAMALLSEEIGVHLPRHLRSFVAELPGVAKAMSAVFNSVAVLALIGVVVEAGKKVYEFAQKSEEAAKKNAEANEKFRDSLTQQNAALAVANDRIEASIAKLEHKPANHFKEALDEARLSAIELSEKLDEAITKQRELLEASSANFAQRLRGDQSNHPLVQGLDDYQQRQRDEDERYRLDLDPKSLTIDDTLRGRKRSPEEAQQEHDRQRAKITSDYYNRLASELADRQRLQQMQTGDEGMTDERFALEQKYGYKNQSEIIPALQSLMGNVGTLGYSQLAQAENDKLKQKQTGITNGNDASADRLREMQRDVEQRKRLHQMDLNQEALYWRDAEKQFTEGSDAFYAVQQKADEASLKALQQAWSPGKLAELKKQIKLDSVAAPKQMGLTIGGGDEQATARAAIGQAELNQRWNEARDRVLALDGALSPHEAALRRAADHTATYTAELAALHEQLAQAQQDGDLAQSLGIHDASNEAKQAQLRSQIDSLSTNYRIQQLDDAQAALGTTWRGMVDSVFDQLIQRSQETQQALAQITAQFIDGSNNELAKLVTGQHTDFSGVFRSASQGLAKTGIEKAEGSLLSAFGLGSLKKRDGQSAESALYFMLANGDKSAVPGASSGIAGAAGKGLLGMLNDSDWASSLFGGRLFGAGGIFGHFASGGDVPGGVAIDVGELGPERFVTPGPGKIIPANQVGGGGVHIGTIDARGTDPALTQAAVARAMQATHAQAVRDASRAMADKQRRTAR